MSTCLLGYHCSSHCKWIFSYMSEYLTQRMTLLIFWEKLFSWQRTKITRNCTSYTYSYINYGEQCGLHYLRLISEKAANYSYQVFPNKLG